MGVRTSGRSGTRRLRGKHSPLSRRIRVQSADEHAAEVHINDFTDALRDKDYETACKDLVPDGFGDIVSGGGTGRGYPLDRCPKLLELTFVVNKVDTSGFPVPKLTRSNSAPGCSS